MTQFSWMTPPDPIDRAFIVEELTADVVVVGAGHAGTMAAREAAEQGAEVIIVEQQDDEKQWVLGVGEIGHINSKWLRKRGLPDVDIDTFVSDWQLRTGNRSNAQLIRRYAEACGDCFDWFIAPLTQEEQDGIHAMLVPPSPNLPDTINGLHAWPGTPNMGMALQTKAVKLCQAIAREHGARFFFKTTAKELVVEEGAVTGVIVQDAEGVYRLMRARTGVILAAGDYSKNADMCRDLLAESADLIDEGDWSGHGWDGSGIRMGIWAGGRLEPRSHAAMGGNYSFPGFDVIGSTAVLRVNAKGCRYSNEGFGTHVLAAIPGARQPNGRLWGIFDATIGEQVTYQAPCHAVFDYTDEARVAGLERALKKAQQHKGETVYNTDKAGDVRPLLCADTIEELAKAMYEDVETQARFCAEVAYYNDLCEAGRDTDFGKDAHLLWPIKKAPFYACGTIKNSHHPGGQSLKLLVTAGGLLIDANQQVLNQDFEPITGLYASGNCSGCRFGAQYTTSVPGQSISIAQTLGRLVGRHLAEKSKSNRTQ